MSKIHDLSSSCVETVTTANLLNVGVKAARANGHARGLVHIPMKVAILARDVGIPPLHSGQYWVACMGGKKRRRIEIQSV